MPKIVIDIPEEDYQEVLRDDYSGTPFENRVFSVIKNGTPFEKVIKDIKAEIRVLPKTYPFVNHIDTYVKEDDVINIIDKHISGKDQE